jgi:hypothetical protein
LQAARKKQSCMSAFEVYLPAEIQRTEEYARRFLSLATEKCSPADLICHVGDNPAGTKVSKGWCTWSAKSCRLPTIRRSSGLYMAVFHNRHMLLKELYVAMGYPSYPLTALCCGVPQYEVFLEGLSYFDSLRALGNSMHVASVGSAVGALMLCTQIKS